MRLKREDLKRLLKPIVREFVEEAIEELITEGFINTVIQESVLKGDVIGHIITEVFRGIGPVISDRPVQKRQMSHQEHEEVIPVRNSQSGHNSELAQMLEMRRNSYNSYAEAETPQPQQKTGINWASVAAAIPPDNDRVGLVAPIRGNLSEINAHLDPLAGVVGAGIDTNVIKELAPGAIWGKEKLNRLLNMGRSDSRGGIQRKSLDEIARNKQLQPQE